MVTGGVEMLIGVSHDELFGPVVTVGLGGIFTEVFGDVTFRVPPFDADEARRALHELKGFKLLEGVRGAKPVDVDALVDTIMNVQRLALDLAGDVRELDINPLVVRPRGAVALDALVVTQVTLNPLPEGVNVDEELVAKLENGVLWLTINRADKGNAIPYYVRDRLIAALPGRAQRPRRARDRAHRRGRAALLHRRRPLGAASRAGKPKPDGAPDMVVGAARRT